MDENKKDAAFEKGVKFFDDLSAKASENAKEIVSTLVNDVVKSSGSEDSFNLSTALFSVSKALSGLASFLYDSEEEFLKDIEEARGIVVSEVIPLLIGEISCGKCEECRSGNPEKCTNKQVREHITSSRFLPLLCSMLLEYDFFNKIIMTHIDAEEAKENADDADEIKYEEE